MGGEAVHCDTPILQTEVMVFAKQTLQEVDQFSAACLTAAYVTHAI